MLNKIKPFFTNIKSTDPTTDGGLRVDGGQLKFHNGVVEQTASGGLVDAKDVLVSANDTTPANLFSKLVAGSNITLNELNDGGNETLEIVSSVAGGGGGVAWTSVSNISLIMNVSLGGNLNIAHGLGITPKILIAYGSAGPSGAGQGLAASWGVTTEPTKSVHGGQTLGDVGVSSGPPNIMRIYNSGFFEWRWQVLSWDATNITINQQFNSGPPSPATTATVSLLFAG